MIASTDWPEDRRSSAYLRFEQRPRRDAASPSGLQSRQSVRQPWQAEHSGWLHPCGAGRRRLDQRRNDVSRRKPVTCAGFRIQLEMTLRIDRNACVLHRAAEVALRTSSRASPAPENRKVARPLDQTAHLAGSIVGIKHYDHGVANSDAFKQLHPTKPTVRTDDASRRIDECCHFHGDLKGLRRRAYRAAKREVASSGGMMRNMSWQVWQVVASMSAVRLKSKRFRLSTAAATRTLAF